MFLGFANFYKQFIKGFSRITTLLISILKITPSVLVWPSYTGVDTNKLDKNGSSGIGSSRIDNLTKNLSINKKVKKASEQIFLFSEPKKPSSTYKKLLPRL